MTLSHNIPFPDWKVSQERSVYLSADGTLPCACSDGISAYGAPAWPSKSSADNLDYAIDCTKWLEACSDRLVSAQASIDGGDGALSILSNGWNSIMRGPTTGRTYAVIWLGGGTPSALYTIHIVLGTASGRQIEQFLYLPINGISSSKAPRPVPTLPDGTPVPPNAIRLPDGSILTDDNGQPYIIA